MSRNNSFVVLNSGGGEETADNAPHSEWALVQAKTDGGATVHAFDSPVAAEKERNNGSGRSNSPRPVSEAEYDNCVTTTPPGPNPIDNTLLGTIATASAADSEGVRAPLLPPTVADTSSPNSPSVTVSTPPSELLLFSSAELAAAKTVQEEHEKKAAAKVAAELKREKDEEAARLQAVAEIRAAAEQRAAKREVEELRCAKLSDSLERQAAAEREEHQARVMKEEEDRQCRLEKEADVIRIRLVEQKAAACLQDRRESMRSEAEARRSVQAELQRAKDFLQQQMRESYWLAEQNIIERQEIEAIAAAADEVSRQRLSDADAKVAEADNERQKRSSDRKCQCLGASSGVHRPDCPLKA